MDTEKSGWTWDAFVKYGPSDLLLGRARKRERERDRNTASRLPVGMVGKNEVQKVTFGFGYVSFEVLGTHPRGNVK